MFHLFKDHSEIVSKTLARIDYAGISIMIAGSNTPPLFYSFFCEEMHGKHNRALLVYLEFRMENDLSWTHVLFLFLCLCFVPCTEIR